MTVKSSVSFIIGEYKLLLFSTIYDKLDTVAKVTLLLFLSLTDVLNLKASLRELSLLVELDAAKAIHLVRGRSDRFTLLSSSRCVMATLRIVHICKRIHISIRAIFPNFWLPVIHMYEMKLCWLTFIEQIVKIAIVASSSDIGRSAILGLSFGFFRCLHFFRFYAVPFGAFDLQIYVLF